MTVKELLEMTVSIIGGIFIGRIGYLWLITGYGKYGQGDGIDFIQGVLLGVCGFLFIGMCIFAT